MPINFSDILMSELTAFPMHSIIKNPYPCSQDCAAIETEPGCECFCANFLYYDENCIPTEINPNCMCVCRGEEPAPLLTTGE